VVVQEKLAELMPLELVEMVFQLILLDHLFFMVVVAVELLAELLEVLVVMAAVAMEIAEAAQKMVMHKLVAVVVVAVPQDQQMAALVGAA
jgi:hypothetical protein